MSDNKEVVNSIINDAEKNKSDISVTVNRNPGSSDEIDLVRVFTFMGKKSGIFVTLMILLAVVGLSIMLCVAEFSRSSGDAVASVQVLYEGNYDMSTITSAYVVKNALSQAGLADRLSVDSVRNNITVSRVLSEEYRQKLEMYSKLDLSKDTITELLGTAAEYEDTYIITLKNGFGDEKTEIEDSELSSLLNAIILKFNESFYDQYSNITTPEYGLGGFDYSGLEYSQAVSILKDSYDSLAAYCDGLSTKFPSFSRKGLTFSDMEELVTLNYDAQVNYFEAYIFYSNTVRDKEAFATLYTHYIKNYKTYLLNAENQIKHYEELIKNYKNETILILSGSGEGTETSITKNLDAYNELVIQQAANYKEKAEYEKIIADYQDRLDNIQNTGTVGVHDYAELTITSIISAYDKLYDDVCEMTESLLASSGYQGSFTAFTTANTSTESFFSSANIKKALEGFAIGAVIGLVIWAVYGLVIELKTTNRKKEEGKV